VRNALIPSRVRTAPAIVESSGVPAVAGTTDKLVLQGIADLFLFASQQKAGEDELRLSQLYMEAVAPFHPEIRAAAVASLRFDNPRNPYRPSHQDARTRCEVIKKTWTNAARDYFFPPYSRRHWYLSGTPLADDCEIPTRWLMEWLTKTLAAYTEQERSWLTKEQIELIPEECFPEGVRDQLLAAIADREAKRLAQERFQKYLDEMDVDLRECRRRVAREDLSEDEIMALAQVERETEIRISADLNACGVSDPLLVEWAEVVARRYDRMWTRKRFAERDSLIVRQVEWAKTSGVDAEYRSLAAMGRLLLRNGQDWYRFSEEVRDAQVAEEVARVAGEAEKNRAGATK